MDDVAKYILTEINANTATYIQAVFGGISGFMGEMLGSMLVLGFLGLTLAWASRIITPDIKELVGWYLKVAVVTTVALNWGYYHYIVDFFTVLPGQLAGAAISATGLVGPIDSINDLLGVYITTGIETAGQAYSGDSWIMGPILALVILLSTILGAFGLLIIIILSQILLSVLLGFGPIFIFARLFNIWGRAFDAWIQQVSNMAMITPFGYGIAMVTFPMAARSMDQVSLKLGMGQVAVLAMIAFVNWIAMKKVYEVTAAVTGGFALTDEYRARRAAYDMGKTGMLGNKPARQHGGLIGTGNKSAVATGRFLSNPGRSVVNRFSTNMVRKL